MKIQGGTFGNSGSAHISRDRKLVVRGAKRAIYTSDDIESFNARADKERGFGAGSFLIGLIVFGLIFGALFGIIGLIIALVLSAGMSFYGDTSNVAEIRFRDGEQVVLDCTPRGIRKLVVFTSG